MRVIMVKGKMVPEWTLTCRNCGFESRSVQQGPTRGKKCPKCLTWHDKTYLK